MSRLRGNLPAYLQQCFGISRRTFERWCVQGDVPGAYRTRGGHWRVRKPARATVKSILRRRDKTRRDEVLTAIIHYPFNLSNFYLSRDTARELAAVKFTLAAHGITEVDIHDPDLDQRDPQKYHILWEESPPTLHPRAFEAVNSPLKFAATMMRFNGRKVTTAALANALGVSVSTLYRRYGQLAVRKVCEEPPLLVPESVGKKTPIRTRPDRK